VIVAEHFSFLDHFFVAVYLRRKVQFMAKSQLFKPPIAGRLPQRRVFPGAARPPRRGGVQDGPHDPRAAAT
jgi:1-acyl-sn-glycerol-3-phosphate acyltransferase